MEDLPITTIVAGLGFGLGLIFGVTVQRTNFCTMGSIADIVLMGDWNRFRAWMLAVAVAILGSQALHASETVDLGETIVVMGRSSSGYWAPPWWSPAALCCASAT